MTLSDTPGEDSLITIRERYELGTLYHSPLFNRIREYFRDSSPDDTIFLFVPYVKTDVLESMLEEIPNKMAIVTTWEPGDIQAGSSELSLYPFCQRRNIALYVSQGLHLKAYSVGLTSAILATGNVSRRGLLPGGNYEAATKLDLTVDDQIFFRRILRKARLVDNAMYRKLVDWSDANHANLPDLPALSDVISSQRKDDFSVSALPMTRSVDELVAGYGRISTGRRPSDDSETAACIIHDLVNYDIDTGLGDEEFVQNLTSAFFAHPFIQKIDEFISPEAYFGRIKEWVQKNCTDVPVPSRRELTGNVQVLLEWFVKLGNGRYGVDVPGAHSQRIYRL